MRERSASYKLRARHSAGVIIHSIIALVFIDLCEDNSTDCATGSTHCVPFKFRVVHLLTAHTRHGDGPPPQLHPKHDPKLTKRREGEAFDASFEHFIIDDSTDFRR